MKTVGSEEEAGSLASAQYCNITIHMRPLTNVRPFHWLSQNLYLDFAPPLISGCLQMNSCNRSHDEMNSSQGVLLYVSIEKRDVGGLYS